MTNPTDESQSPEWEFHPVARLGEIPPEQGRSYALGGTVIGLFHSAGQYFAINDFCPHQGASLSGGYVAEGMVMCPWHAWKFRLQDGAWADSPKSPLRCASYPVRIVGETIEVGLPATPRPQS